jgi:hypothetical protein
MKKELLKDVTFLIPVRFDSVVRLENARAVVSFIDKHFDTHIRILEASPQCNGIFRSLIRKKAEYSHIEDHDIIFHKTRYTNILAKKVDTPFFSVWDADVLADTKQIVNAVEELRNQQADMAYPYDGSFLDTSDIIRKLYLEKENIKVLHRYKNYMDLLYGRGVKGGAVFINTSKYLMAGMDNEDFYGWGNEDYERFFRFESLGYKIYRSPGILFHLSHPRDLNGSYRNNTQYLWTTDQLRKIKK